MIEFIAGFIVGVIVTVLVLFVWLAWQATFIERETSGEEYHRER
jgi:hypothetical protein